MRKPQSYLNTSVIYQISLRAFTNEGTLRAAEKLLPYVKSTGVDIVYIWPCFTCDTYEKDWSPRQIASGMNNPKNPYRIADYYNVDPEYGTNDDLKSFIATAHALGMRVMLDLVYFHCGPTAVFLESNPDFVMRNEDGTPDTGLWNFPKLNFANPELREYLIRNMEMYVRDFGCDGYRCDVGDAVPLDFWAEARERIEAIDPEVIMLNEGTKPEYLDVFDINYNWSLRQVLEKIVKGDAPASALKDMIVDFSAKNLQGSFQSIMLLDNHDTVSDDYDNRLEKRLGARAMDACFVINLTLPHVPFIYCGSEIADTNRHSLWASREHAGNFTIDWQNLTTEEGNRRLLTIMKLCELRHSLPALGMDGGFEFKSADKEKVVVYLRGEGESKFAVVVNLSNEKVRTLTDVDADAIYPWTMSGASAAISDGKLSLVLDAYGFAIIEVN